MKKASEEPVAAKKPQDTTDVQVDQKKTKMVTNTAKEVAADLEKEKANELIKPHAKADSDKDTGPTNVQLKAKINR